MLDLGPTVRQCPLTSLAVGGDCSSPGYFLLGRPGNGTARWRAHPRAEQQRRRPGPGRIATAVLIGSGAASAAALAIASALVTIAVILGCLTGLAFLGGIAWLVYRARQDGRGRPIATPAVWQVPPEARPRLEGFHISETDRGRELHIHLHGLTRQQIAAIVTQRGADLKEDSGTSGSD
jgi:hypothetical protein